MEMYRNLLQKDKMKFFALVLKNYEEKTTKPDTDSITVDFESQLLKPHFSNHIQPKT